MIWVVISHPSRPLGLLTSLALHSLRPGTHRAGARVVAVRRQLAFARPTGRGAWPVGRWQGEVRRRGSREVAALDPLQGVEQLHGELAESQGSCMCSHALSWHV